MRRDGDARVRPERTVRREGLRVEDVQHDPRQLPAIERGQDIRHHLLHATPDLHEARAVRQPGMKSSADVSMAAGFCGCA